MLRKSWVPVAMQLVLLCSAGVRLNADSVTCTSGGTTITSPSNCSLGGVTSQVTARYNISGNALLLFDGVETDQTPSRSSGGTEGGSGIIGDVFSLPVSNPNDVFKITIDFSTRIQITPGFGRTRTSSFRMAIGPGSAASPVLSFDSTDPTYALCEGTTIGCIWTGTVLADDLTSVVTFGTESLSIPNSNAGLGSNAFSGVTIQIQQFAPDGVTPNSALLLTLVCIGALPIFMLRCRRSRGRELNLIKP